MALEPSNEPGFVRAQLSALPDPLWNAADRGRDPDDAPPSAVSGLRRALRGLAVSGLVAGLIGLSLVLSGAGAELSRVNAFWSVAVGWVFIAGGILAWSRRPDNRFGPLMSASGFAWLVITLQGSGSPILFTAGVLLGGLWSGLFVHMLLAFPSGRLGGRPARAIAGAAYLVGTVLYAAPFLAAADVRVCAECPDLLSFFEPAPGAAEALAAVHGSAMVALTLAVCATLGLRWRRAAATERRASGPMLASGALALALVTVPALDASHMSVASAWGPVHWIGFVALAAVPLNFGVGLVHSRFFRATAVADLVERLSEAPTPGRLRQALARALDDPSLTLAYWLPDQERYVDGDGRAVELPAPGSGRAATEVEHDGRRVAAIVHDAFLCDEPELVHGAGAAAALALENERLDAALRARVEELHDSRTRMLEAADGERKRLERNLHDGAQQRLVAVSLRLRLAMRKLGTDQEAAALMLSEGFDELQLAIDDLRELARGIHPAVLSDRGLEPALAALAGRAAVPVQLDASVPDRLDAAIEAAAYYVVAEALTNVAKYAEATRAEVAARRENGRLLVEVRDDGVGGADPRAGSGLTGLWDRVGALDGRIEVISPPGAGTVVRAEIPVWPVIPSGR